MAPGSGSLDDGVDDGQRLVGSRPCRGGSDDRCCRRPQYRSWTFAVGADFLDDLAARADDLADLVHGDLGGHHLGRILGELRRAAAAMAWSMISSMI